MLIFKTERLIVRRFEAENDVDNFFKINGDPDVMKYIRPVKSRKESKLFFLEQIRNYETDPVAGRWAVIEKQSGRFAGSFALIPVEGKTERQLGYALLKEFWGKGYATELMKHGIEYAFSHIADHVIYAITEKMNLASRRVLEKSGFQLEEEYLEDGKEIFRYMITRPAHQKSDITPV